jgi:hypothetical protein
VITGVVVGMAAIPIVASIAGNPVPIDPVQGVIATIWFMPPVLIGYGAGRGVARLRARSRSSSSTPSVAASSASPTCRRARHRHRPRFTACSVRSFALSPSSSRSTGSLPPFSSPPQARGSIASSKLIAAGSWLRPGQLIRRS